MSETAKKTDDGYHTGRSLIGSKLVKKEGFRFQSWPAAVAALNSAHRKTEKQSERAVVLRSVESFKRFHLRRLEEEVEYVHYCRDSVNYRSLFHIIFVLVMKQMLTEETEKPAAADAEADPADSIPGNGDPSLNGEVTTGTTQLAFDSVLEQQKSPLAKQESEKDNASDDTLEDSDETEASNEEKDNWRRIVYPWGTEIRPVEKHNEAHTEHQLKDVLSSDDGMQHRRMLIQEKLSLKRKGLIRSETAQINPSNPFDFAFNFGSPSTSTEAAFASNSQVRRLLLFAEFQKEKTGQSWCDPDFPATNSSLYLDWDDDDEFLQEAAEQEDLTGAFWCRPQEMLPQAGVGYTVCSTTTKGNPFDPREVIQGDLGDCWLLSAVSVVALYPELMQRVVVSKEVNPAGIYHMRLFLNGSWTNVVVDDRIPCYLDQSLEIRTPLQSCRHLKVVNRPSQKAMVKLGKGTNAMYLPMPQYCRSESGTVLWAMLIEKAYAKYMGCYEALEGGHVHNALVDLTGGFSQVYSLRDDVELVASGALWNKLLEYSG